MNMTLHQFDLPLKHPFTIARGTVNVQPTLVVELHDGSCHGFGEATASPYYGATLRNMESALEDVRSVVRDWSPDDPARLWDELNEQLQHQPFAQCALDQAAHDLWGKHLGKPVFQLWDLDVAAIPDTSFTIGIDALDRMVAKLHEMPDWPIYKIKLGTDNDLEIVRELRQHTSAVFRVDANCGWSADQTIAHAKQLRSLNVEFIEQPLPAEDWDGMRHVYENSVLPVIADESCVREPDVARCGGFFHGVNIKLVKCGGLTPARRMIEQARAAGLKTMVGCMTESTVGISSIAQLLPLVDYADLDGPLLLSRDIATGITIERGRVRYPAAAGCGVALLNPERR